ncbi:hypothetical protein H7H82_09995 [Mycobacterium heidelbergense]|uniref:hypothetical protein n=1 Tax=Mycobacterium heidelbergense TaxID=53376 RepID=UPI0011508EBE|nr:hypothetical protein [Mycobacterium heidelbergense]MCV7050921.1 hypothetical protein [Mycobacterium heidelbergense]BBZ51192.1 hypothetical protein MHEI_29090 [Mycobacterium heidelbergense]
MKTDGRIGRESRNMMTSPLSAKPEKREPPLQLGHVRSRGIVSGAAVGQYKTLTGKGWLR